MREITLEPSELVICQLLGGFRTIVNRAANVPIGKVGDHDNMEGDIQGMIAELAFSKMFNTFPDLGLSPRSGSADGVYKGKSYDIKSTTHKNGRLIATTKVNPDVDLYVLAIVDGATVAFPGWAFKSEFIREDNITDIGYGPTYVLERDKLRPFTKVD